MSTNRRSLIAMAIAAAITAIAPVPSFGMIVFDPTNYVENLITAIKTTLSLIENIKANMDGQVFSNTFAASPEMQEMMSGLDAANSMYAALKDSKKVMDNLQNIFGASPYDNWGDFAANISQRKQSGDKQAQMLYDSAFAADKQVRAAYVANRKIQDAASSVNGPTEAVQSVVNAVGVVIDQNSTMLYTLAAANKMHGQELERQATEREQYEKSVKRYKENVQTENDHDLNQLNQAGLGPK